MRTACTLRVHCVCGCCCTGAWLSEFSTLPNGSCSKRSVAAWFRTRHAELPRTQHLDPIYHGLQAALTRVPGGIHAFVHVRLLSDAHYHFMPITYLRKGGGREAASHIASTSAGLGSPGNTSRDLVPEVVRVDYASTLPSCASGRFIGHAVKISHFERSRTDRLLRTRAYAADSLFGWLTALVKAPRGAHGVDSLGAGCIQHSSRGLCSNC